MIGSWVVTEEKEEFLRSFGGLNRKNSFLTRKRGVLINIRGCADKQGVGTRIGDVLLQKFLLGMSSSKF